MQKGFARLAVALMLVGCVGSANSAKLNFATAEKQTMYQGAMSGKGQATPVGFQPKVGAMVPQSLTLHAFPSNVVSKVSATKNYEYVKLQNSEILLINQKDRQVAATSPNRARSANENKLSGNIGRGEIPPHHLKTKTRFAEATAPREASDDRYIDPDSYLTEAPRKGRLLVAGVGDVACREVR